MQTAAPHARMAILGEDLVVFDLRHDRYVALPGALGAGDHQASTTSLAARLQPGAAAALSEAGLLIDGGGNDPLPLSQPNLMLQPGRCAVRLRDIVCLVIALVRVGWRLSRSRHCSTFHMERLPPPPLGAEGAYADAIARLAALRILVPTPRRCLPAALVAGMTLKMQGLDTEIIFGVRSHPFEAHCWLQRGPLVIDDDLDRVRSYTPIAAGRL